ncbi:N-6 DNA methylase [Propionivibrio sp.]|uniref:type I restriction-modification system subunit M n=1 Tax=Propionivibrio sp. TaxID=2212460 RepID=UPI0025E5FC35|nr:N-6 DNA methylase [Propionivibrio sp.]
MSDSALQNISNIEDSLWAAADQLRANSKLTSSEYCMPVLGVIFLRHASNRYQAAVQAIEADQAAGRMPRRALVKGDFIKRRALMLPEIARYEHLLKLPSGTNLGTALVDAMNAIEADFEPLAGQLPRDYERFDNKLLEDLLRNFDSAALRSASGDVFGRIYEYFLMKFAMQGAQDNGEFFTPPSLVQTLVNVIEPDHGVVLDLACGSAGMFVQTSHFIEHEGLDTLQRVTFYGQEKTATTIRLAKMNLAVHGLEGDIREANSFYDDVHRLQDGRALWGNCDFVMANPPFNVDMVDAERVKDDRRLPFGLPGVNKDKRVSNGNYLWISYFHSYLSATGRAGFVMSSQASSAGHGEKEVRRKLVETGDVDVMIAIRSNFFYTRTVPCELWHFDKNKPPLPQGEGRGEGGGLNHKGNVLMLDARNIYRKVTRKIYDFSPEQQANLAAIVWLYRGQRERFLGLVQDYCERLATASAAIAPALTAFETQLAASQAPLAAFAASVADLDAIPSAKRQPLADALAECSQAAKAYVADRATLLGGLTGFISTAIPVAYSRPTELPSSRRKPGSRLVAHQPDPGLRHDDGALQTCAHDCPAAEAPESGLLGESEINTAQHKARQTLDPLADAARGLIKQIDLLYKLAARAAQLAQDLSTDEVASEFFDRRATGKLIKQLDEERKTAVEQLKAAISLHRQIAWLQDRFPTAEMQDVPGLCKVVSRAEIEAADWSLTPGRYVGVAPTEVDADFDFEQTLRDIHVELADLNREAVELAAKIQENFEELGV